MTDRTHLHLRCGCGAQLLLHVSLSYVCPWLMFLMYWIVLINLFRDGSYQQGPTQLIKIVVHLLSLRLVGDWASQPDLGAGRHAVSWQRRGRGGSYLGRARVLPTSGRNVAIGSSIVVAVAAAAALAAITSTPPLPLALLLAATASPVRLLLELFVPLLLFLLRPSARILLGTPTLSLLLALLVLAVVQTTLTPRAHTQLDERLATFASLDVRKVELKGRQVLYAGQCCSRTRTGLSVEDLGLCSPAPSTWPRRWRVCLQALPDLSWHLLASRCSSSDCSHHGRLRPKAACSALNRLRAYGHCGTVA